MKKMGKTKKAAPAKASIRLQAQTEEQDVLLTPPQLTTERNLKKYDEVYDSDSEDDDYLLSATNKQEQQQKSAFVASKKKKIKSSLPQSLDYQLQQQQAVLAPSKKRKSKAVSQQNVVPPPPGPPPGPPQRIPNYTSQSGLDSILFDSNDKFKAERSVELEELGRPLIPWSQADLEAGKKSLKAPMAKKKKLVPIKGTRNDVYNNLENFDDKSFYPLHSGKRAIEILGLSGDITELDFSGIDQMTDSFFKYLAVSKIEFPHLSSITCDGCIHLSDLAIKWLLNVCNGRELKTMSYKGCRLLSSVALSHILSRCPVMETVHLDGTSVSILPKGLVDSNVMVKLNGCPIVHSRSVQQYFSLSDSKDGRQKVVHTKVPHYKVVIRSDNDIPLSVGACLLDGKYEKPKEGVYFFTSDNWLSAHGNQKTTVHMFDITGKSYVNAVDMMLSNGTILILPFSCKIQPDDIIKDLTWKCAAAVSKAKHLLIVLLQVIEGDNKEQDGNQIMIGVQQGFSAITTTLEEEVSKNSMENVRGLDFKGQQQYASLCNMEDAFELTKVRLAVASIHCDTKAEKIKRSDFESLGQLLNQTTTKVDHQLIPTFSSVDQDFIQYLIEPTLNSKHQLPLHELIKELPPKSREEYFFSSLVKAYEIMHQKGICLFYPKDERKMCITDLHKFCQVLSLVHTAPSRTVLVGIGIRIPSVGENVACWTKTNLKDALIKLGVNNVKDMMDFLVDQNQLFCLPCDRYAESQESYALVPYSCLPEAPLNENLTALWPDPPPDSEPIMERQRHYRLKHGVPSTLMACILRSCSQTASFLMLWKRGALIQHGFVDCLLEFEEDQSVIILSVRVHNEGFDGKNKSVIENCLWNTLTLYSNMIEAGMQEYRLYAKITVPCPHCELKVDRKDKINEDNHKHFPISLIKRIKMADKTSSVRCDGKCGRSDIPTEEFLRPDGFSTLIPAHDVKGVHKESKNKESLRLSKCFLCYNCVDQGIFCEKNRLNGISQRTCACNTKLSVCPECGICERCIQTLMKLESQLYPVLHTSKAMEHLKSLMRPNSDPYSLTHKGNITVLSPDMLGFSSGNMGMSPAYFNILELVLMEPGPAEFDLEFYTDSMRKNKPFLVYRSRKGEIDTEYDGKRGKHKNNLWSANKGDTIQIVVQYEKNEDDFSVAIRKTTLRLLLNGELMRMESKLPVVVYPSLQVYHNGKRGRSGVTQVTEFLFLVPQVKFLREKPAQLDSQDENERSICKPRTNSRLVGFSDVEVKQYGLLWSYMAVNHDSYVKGLSTELDIPYVLLPETVTSLMARFPHWSNLVKESFKLHALCGSVSPSMQLLLEVMKDSSNVDPENFQAFHLQNVPGIEPNEHLNKKNSKQLNLLYDLAMQGQVFLPEKFDNILKWESSCDMPSSYEAAHWIHKALTQLMWHSYFFKDKKDKGEVSAEVSAALEELKVEFGEPPYLCDAHNNCCLSTSGGEFEPNILQSPNASLLRMLYIDGSLASDPVFPNGSFPDDFFKCLPSLMVLHLKNDALNGLPRGIGNCKHLIEVNIEGNKLTDLPSDFGECLSLESLNISSNSLRKIPAPVIKCTKLKKLFAENLFLTALPENIGNLKELEELHLNGNCLRVLPPSVRMLCRLRVLGLAGVAWFHQSWRNTKIIANNTFTNFIHQHNLESAWSANSKYTDAVEIFDQFDTDGNGLLDEAEIAAGNEKLYLRFPRFGVNGEKLAESPENPEPASYVTSSGFPAEITSLKRLKSLDLSFQGFQLIPDEISKLKRLETFKLSCNPFLEDLTPGLGELNLQKLDLSECPSLKTPPKEIQARGLRAILSYLKRLQTGGVQCKRTKLMLVGLGGAGKTSLAQALLNGTGKAELESGQAITDGIDIHSWTVKHSDDSITFSVWDFAGQTVYYNTHQFFLSNRAVYLLLWNIRLGHEHAGLDFWLSSISVHAPKAPIFVIGTHLDKVAKSDLPTEEMQKKYPQIIGFHFVSTHTGEGVRELQTHMMKTTLQQSYMGESIPQVWLNFEKAVIAKRTQGAVVSYSDVEEAATDNGILDKTEVVQAVQFLHELGTLQHFDNDFLRDRVVVDPQWIVDVMACVVSVKDSPIKEGKFYHKDISVVWKDYPSSLHQWLLRLTEEYDLTFPLPDKDINLVPCLLPEKQPPIDWPEVDKNSSVKETKMIYRFVYLPAGLFNRGQVRLYQYSDSSTIWKRGSILRKKGHMALLTQTKENELLLKVQGSQPENFVFMVHEVFEGLISESFHGVSYEYLAPCPDCQKLGLKDPFMFSSTTLRRAKEIKAPFLQCSTYFHNVTVTDLNTNMPADNSVDYDQQLVSTVQGLSDLKKQLGTDLFLSYCEGDLPERSSHKHSVDPKKVRDDLQKSGYTCFYPKNPSQPESLEKMAIMLRDSKLFIAFISNSYAADKQCCDLFHYAVRTLKKPLVLVVIGSGYEWQSSNIGVLVTDQVFVNMQQDERYSHKIEELYKVIKERSESEKVDVEFAPCFISYCWANSSQAVAKGSKKVEGALGWGDPRDFKEYLEEMGVKCWIDTERVGKGGLFEDIAEGLRRADVVVACVSDEYAASPNCMMEFRFAVGTLNLPTIVVVVGTGRSWKRTAIGMLTLKNMLPELNFQEETLGGKEKLLKLVNGYLAPGESDEPSSSLSLFRSKKKEQSKRNVGRKTDKTKSDGRYEKKDKEDANEEKKSFDELYELAQRKFLRQITEYSEASGEIYPRLFALDFMDMISKEEDLPSRPTSAAKTENEELVSSTTRPMTASGRPGLSKRPSTGHRGLRGLEQKSFKQRKFAV